MMRFTLALVVTATLATSQRASPPQRLELATPQGKLTATLTLPPTAERMPIALLVSTKENRWAAIAETLAAEGIASLQTDPAAAGATESPDLAVRDVAGWITRLRNDTRFERIVVVGRDDGAIIATRAARAARADGVGILGGADAARQATLEWAQPSMSVGTFTDPTGVSRLGRFIRTISIPRHPEGERRSPRDVVIADIGGARLSIEYGRPSKRGRVIWGSLVAYTRWWMPGADEATSFTTSVPLVFGSVTIPAGDYTLYTQPGDTTFSLVVNGETGQFHTTYHPDRDVAHIAMQRTAPTSPAEQLTFAIEPTADGGVLKLTWDDREYGVPFRLKP